MKGFLHLLFYPKDARKFDILERNLIESPYYIHDYQPDLWSQMFLFKVPEEYRREYDKFLSSKYSEMSENYKKIIIGFHQYSKTGNGVNTIRVLYKEEEAYKEREAMINEGIPYKDWTRIPRDIEIGMKWDETLESTLLETYSKDMQAGYRNKSTEEVRIDDNN